MSRSAYLPNRRDFLVKGSLALAGTVAGARALSAGVPVRVPYASPRAADAFLSHRMSAADMQPLVAHALDAARSAGAAYADIRMAERHVLEAEVGRVILSTQFTYGVRALVDDLWGFAYGRSPTTDAVVQCARQAASSARVTAHLSTEKAFSRDASWIPALVATGEWQTPIEIDPFTVPVEQHGECKEAIQMIVESVPGAQLMMMNRWVRETRVLGATTGTFIAQHQYRVLPFTSFGVRVARNMVSVHAGPNDARAMGFEFLRAPDLLDQIKVGLDGAVALARLPMRPLEVGRYPIVLDGCVMSAILGVIVGPSLELDRVLGDHTEASGMSRVSLDLLGTEIANPLATITGNRTAPAVSAAQWDDEGAVPREHTVIRQGVLVDYHTSGQTVSALQPWYAQHGLPLRSNGCAVAPNAHDPVAVRMPQMAMHPGSTRASLEDLCKGMGHGIMACSDAHVTSDQQLTSGSIGPWNQLLEVSKGQIVRRLRDTGLQFNTSSLLKGLTAVGDRTTVRSQNVRLEKGMPWVRSDTGATAPAVFCKEINAVSTHF